MISQSIGVMRDPGQVEGMRELGLGSDTFSKVEGLAGNLHEVEELALCLFADPKIGENIGTSGPEVADFWAGRSGCLAAS